MEKLILSTGVLVVAVPALAQPATVDPDTTVSDAPGDGSNEGGSDKGGSGASGSSGDGCSLGGGFFRSATGGIKDLVPSTSGVALATLDADDLLVRSGTFIRRLFG